MTQSRKTRRPRPTAAMTAAQVTRQRVNQETVDEMAEFRRQGLTFKEIGARLGCSERTARRYASQVQPQIQLPPATPEPEAQDASQLREGLARWFSDLLYKIEEHPRPRESVRFMSEAMRLIRERLAETDPLTLELVANDSRLKLRLLNEAVGPTYHDFKRHIEWDANMGYIDTKTSAARWVPIHERPVILDEDMPPDDS